MKDELSHTAAAAPQPGKPSSKRRPEPGDFGLSLCPFSAEEINSWLFDVSLALVRAGYGYPKGQRTRRNGLMLGGPGRGRKVGSYRRRDGLTARINGKSAAMT